MGICFVYGWKIIFSFLSLRVLSFVFIRTLMCIVDDITRKLIIEEA